MGKKPILLQLVRRRKGCALRERRRKWARKKKKKKSCHGAMEVLPGPLFHFYCLYFFHCDCLIFAVPCEIYGLSGKNVGVQIKFIEGQSLNYGLSVKIVGVKLNLKATKSTFIESQNSNYGLSAKIVEVELNLKVTIIKP
jgi:hypothetical protein